MFLNLLIALMLQAPAPVEKVLVGLLDGQQLVIENPEFSGFIQGRIADAVLMYRQQEIHGQMPAKTIARIDFGEYQRGKPFAMTVTLRNGQKLEVESERYDFVTLKGETALGTVLIKHPDPVSAPLRLSTRRPDRKDDLTIQYLEFQAPTE